MKKKFTWVSTFSFIVIITMTISSPIFGKMIFVHHGATGSNDGSSWSNAFPQLQAAFDLAAEGDTICVASGTYYPTFKFGGDVDQYLTFFINKDIIILGGFSGEAGTEGSMELRDPVLHLTKLSGDIGVQNDTLDNVFHVVYIDHVSDTMVLDGFTISGAYGFAGEGLDATGGGMFLDGDAGRCNPVIRNCIIRDNNVKENGGGVTAQGSLGGTVEPTFYNCQFLLNRGAGGGAYFGYVDENGKENPVFISCSFKGNTARTSQGSAIANVAHSSVSNQLLINCILTGNNGPFTSAISLFTTGTGVVHPTIINSTIAGNSGGSIRISDIGAMTSSLTIRNSILRNNPTFDGISVGGLALDVTHSITSGFVEGVGNLGLDPEFVDAPTATNVPHLDGDVRLKISSPGIDAGRNADVPAAVDTDADGKPRRINSGNGLPGIVDIGAFEFQGPAVGTSTIRIHGAIELFPNPVSDVIHLRIGDDLQDGRVTIVDCKGHVVQQLNVKSIDKIESMSVDHLPSGTYFIYLASGNHFDVASFVIM